VRVAPLKPDQPVDQKNRHKKENGECRKNRLNSALTGDNQLDIHGA
jgi:hypothetical protein